MPVDNQLARSANYFVPQKIFYNVTYRTRPQKIDPKLVFANSTGFYDFHQNDNTLKNPNINTHRGHTASYEICQHSHKNVAPYCKYEIHKTLQAINTEIHV
jgi:hypothetical protein